MSLSASHTPPLETVYSEQLDHFKRAFGLFLNDAAEGRGGAATTRRRMLSTLIEAIKSIETALMADRVRPQGERLVCPLSADGMEYYRELYSLNEGQWEQVRESIAELSLSAGEEVSAHLQRRLRLPCRECQAVSPLTPLPGASAS